MTLLSGDKGEGYNRPDYNRRVYCQNSQYRTLQISHTRLGLKMADQTELFMEFNSGQFTY